MKFKYRFPNLGEVEFEITSVVFSSISTGGGGISISYTSAIGWGEVNINSYSPEQTVNGPLQVGTETYGKDFAKAAFACLIDNANLFD